MRELHTSLERTSRGSVVWPIPAELLPPLPETLDWRGIELRRKAEFHLTVLDHRDAADRFGKKIYDPLFERLQRAWQELDPRIELLDELWLLRKPLEDSDDFAYSLAAACVAPAIAAGRLLMAEWSGSGLSDALPHITLFWRGDPRGIAVRDRDAWRERCVVTGPWASFGLIDPATTATRP